MVWPGASLLLLVEETLLEAQQAAVVLVLTEAVPEIGDAGGFIFCSVLLFLLEHGGVRKMAIITGL